MRPRDRTKISSEMTRAVMREACGFDFGTASRIRKPSSGRWRTTSSKVHFTTTLRPIQPIARIAPTTTHAA